MNNTKKYDAYVLMCGDAAYFQHIAACLISLLEKNLTLTFSVVVLVTRSTPKSDEKLRRTFKDQKNIILEVSAFNPADLDSIPMGLGIYYPKEIWARFWIDQYFPEDVDRAIYLDGDMVMTGSIQPLLQLDLGDHVLAAVDIPGSIRPGQLNYESKKGYFNSGMMVINLKKWREIDARGLLIAGAHQLGPLLRDPDQDVLNFCFHDKYLQLDYIWNAISPFFKEVHSLSLSQSEIDRVIREVRIVHFNGTAKPWNYLCFHPYAKTYLGCVAKTEWRGFVPKDYSALNILKKRVIGFLGERRAGILSSLVRKN